MTEKKIEIIRVEAQRACSVCHSKQNVKALSFRYCDTNSGTQVALCVWCRQMLVNEIWAEDTAQWDSCGCCTSCGERDIDWNSQKIYTTKPYCPNCGAYMRNGYVRVEQDRRLDYQKSGD